MQNTDKNFILKIKFDKAFDNLFFSSKFTKEYIKKYQYCPNGLTIDTLYDNDDSPIYFKVIQKIYGYEYSSRDRVIGDYISYNYDYSEEQINFMLDYIKTNDFKLWTEIQQYKIVK